MDWIENISLIISDLCGQLFLLQKDKMGHQHIILIDIKRKRKRKKKSTNI